MNRTAPGEKTSQVAPRERGLPQMPQAPSIPCLLCKVSTLPTQTVSLILLPGCAITKKQMHLLLLFQSLHS